ncbi:diacylglycerol kinase [Larsenimonas rhizosphaerae]|uniref:Diacylglycerol kinase n=1 Tax=Larsenimonas rhizosphaerae TaxID=2944682 RepID=A0AA41ZIF8_9GAMM|nr:diacylglycerol kinase [Larsenimonas rhizosphaerae]MCM2129803.1 diacylglycerol kinase [Larsenimonas rhizosphaerae]MCX2524463.1 diacylglycerol kinase [Larsenimonas rhizosphaerae]
MKPQHTGFGRLLHSTRYSLQGLAAGWRHEAALRLELVLLAVLFPLSFWIGRTPTEWMLLMASALFVISVELLNSAIETVVDRIGLEKHELSGRAKDLGSAAVLTSSLLAGLVWGGLLLVRLGWV